MTSDNTEKHQYRDKRDIRRMEQSVEEEAAKKKVKPALKKVPVHSKDGSSAQSPTGDAAGKKKKELHWDEEAIEEHDQLRGTRMKIEEPNTPFTTYDSGAESDGSHPKSPIQQQNPLNWDQLQGRLADMAANFPESPGSYSDEDRKQQFREHRKKHYNEMELVRKFRSSHPGGVFDDDEDNDADDDMDMK